MTITYGENKSTTGRSSGNKSFVELHISISNIGSNLTVPHVTWLVIFYIRFTIDSRISAKTINYQGVFYLEIWKILMWA